MLTHSACSRSGTESATTRPQESPLAPGSLLTRNYKGRRLVVRVLNDGFEYEGTKFGSLTAIAKHVTGSAWNGRLFFGLTKTNGAA